MSDGFAAMGHTTCGDDPYPPGLTGAYALLKDEELWQALGPVLEGVKAFSSALHNHGRSGSEAERPANDDA